MAYKRISPQPVVEGGTGAQTLTGVCIGNGTSAITGNAVTQYNVLVGGASNAINSVAPSSTTGYVLTSNGASANPSFQAISTGAAPGLVLISSQTASSSASLTWTSGISSTNGNNYLLTFYGLIPTASVQIIVQISTDGGSTYKTTGYVNITGLGSDTNGIYINPSQAGKSAGVVTLFNLTSGTDFVGLIFNGNANFKTGGSPVATAGPVGCGFYNTASQTVNALKVLAVDGSNFSGTFSLYYYKT